MSVIVFLSAVSSEFHHRDPERPQQFQPYREVLAKALRRMGPDYAVVVQEDLAQGFGDLLETLDVEVSQSSVVVHLVGNKAGIVPEAASLRRLHARHPDLLANEPELSATLLDAVDVSFTQWEVYLAFHHGGRRLVYIAEADAPRSPVAKDMSMEPSQAKHLERLKATGEHRETFAGQDELAWKVISSVARYGLGPEEPGQRATPAAIEAAREDAQGLTNAIAQRIRQPEVRYVAEADEIGVERFLRAVDTAALERELDRRSALEIVHDYRGTLRDAVEAKPTDADLKDLAFADSRWGITRMPCE